MNLPCPTEHEEGCILTQWRDAHPDKRVRLLFHIPNSGAGGSRGMAGKMKASGVSPGCPDYLLPVMSVEQFSVGPTGHVRTKARMVGGLWIELKRMRGGVVSAEQKAWHEALTEQGYRVVTCRGASEAFTAISAYLGIEEI